MKNYQHNKYPKDTRFLATFRKSFNNDRKRNGLSIEEAAHELGMSISTYDAKMKPSNVDNDITISEWMHHLDMSADFSSLEYIASRHGFELKKLEVTSTCKEIVELNVQADKTMIEFNEAWAKTKEALSDGELTNKELILVLKELDDAINEAQQLKEDLECKREER